MNVALYSTKEQDERRTETKRGLYHADLVARYGVATPCETAGDKPIKALEYHISPITLHQLLDALSELCEIYTSAVRRLAVCRASEQVKSESRAFVPQN